MPTVTRSAAIPNSAMVIALNAGLTANRQRLWRGFVLPAVLILVWFVATRWSLVDTRIMVGPWAVVETAWKQITTGHVLEGLLASLGRNLAGFAIGSLAGLLLGALLGTSRIAERLIGPTFNAAKQIALFAWIPLLSVWFGMGEPAKIAFIALAVFYPVVLNTFEGIRSVGKEYVEVARAFEFSRWQLFRRVILPAATPQIFTGLHLALIYSWLATVGAEYFLKSGLGIGNIMIDGREHFLMDQVIFGVAIVGLVGFAFNRIAAAIERRLLRWRQRPA